MKDFAAPRNHTSGCCCRGTGMGYCRMANRHTGTKDATSRSEMYLYTDSRATVSRATVQSRSYQDSRSDTGDRVQYRDSAVARTSPSASASGSADDIRYDSQPERRPGAKQMVMSSALDIETTVRSAVPYILVSLTTKHGRGFWGRGRKISRR
jgi:hypothetical protein